MNSDEIKSFYDDFLESRMLDYRIHGNLRIDRAAERVLEFVCPDSHVLDIGCGIGIVSERIAGSLKDGHVWGTDISDQNIWYARETVGQSHASFFTADITSNPEQVRSRVKVPLDVISLIDVIEHIPKGEHSDLFQFLQSLVGSRAFVVLTYPSPQYQRHLMAQNPEELQIIDQVIEREELLSVAETAGFFLRHYSLEDVWKQNQYVHCVLQSDPFSCLTSGFIPQLRFTVLPSSTKRKDTNRESMGSLRSDSLSEVEVRGSCIRKLKRKRMTEKYRWPNILK